MKFLKAVETIEANHPDVSSIKVDGESIFDTDISDDNYSRLCHALNNNPWIRSFSIVNYKMSAVSLIAITQLKCLVSLELPLFRELTYEEAVALASSTSLKSLSITNTICERTLAALMKSNSLTDFSLSGADSLSDEMVWVLSNNTRLINLTIDVRQMNDTQILYLASNRTLKFLSLDTSGISDQCA